MTAKIPAPQNIQTLTATAKSQFAEILELDAKKAALDAAYEKAKATKVIALGTTLSIIKAALPHGSWYPWLESNFSGSKSTATRCMQCAQLANRATLHDFGYSQLTLLLPLADELPAFLAAMTANGTNAAGLTIRDLREAVQSWRKNHSLAKTVTIDTPAVTLIVDEQNTIAAATVFNIEPPPPTFTPATPLPPRYEQLSLFNLPALPVKIEYQLPTMITEAASKLSAPVFLLSRCDARAEFIPPVILITTEPLAAWTQRLKSMATATITTRLPMIRAGLVKERNVMILYNGTELDDFASAFARFGRIDVPYKPKSSAASNSEALDK